VPNAGGELRGPEAKNKNAGRSPRQLDCLVRTRLIHQHAELSDGDDASMAHVAYSFASHRHRG
jgi:hypothetical protein